jgi:hypothetical protein
MTHEKETFKSADPAISPCPMPGWTLLASNGRETKENDGGRRYGYIHKQEKGGRDDRISSIQIRRIKKEKKRVERK